MKRGINFLLVVIVAFAAGAAGLYAARQNASQPVATPAQSAALARLTALDLPDTTGKQQALKQWQGKVLVVNFCVFRPDLSAVFYRAKESMDRSGRGGIRWARLHMREAGVIGGAAFLAERRRNVT